MGYSHIVSFALLRTLFTIVILTLEDVVNEFIVYEFQLKYAEIYTMKSVLEFPLPKTWKDMVKAHEIVMGWLKYEVCMNRFIK